MPREDLIFNIRASSARASATFTRLAERVERLSDQLDELDRKRVSPQIDIDVDRSAVARAATRVVNTSERVARRRSGSFWGALFTPRPDIISTLRTGIPRFLGTPITAAGLALGAVFAGSFVAAVFSSGMFAAIGAGFTGLAAVVLRENRALRAEFTALGGFIQGQLENVAAPMIPAFSAAMTTVRNMFGPSIREPLMSIFEGLAPAIQPLVRSAVDTVGRVLDSLATPQFLDGFRTVIDSITVNLPRLGDAFGEMFAELASNADDIAEAFGGVTTVISGLIGFVGDAAGAFTDLFNAINNSFSLLGSVAGPLITLVDAAIDAVGELDRNLAELGGGGDVGERNRELLTGFFDEVNSQITRTVELAKQGHSPVRAFSQALAEDVTQTERVTKQIGRSSGAAERWANVVNEEANVAAERLSNHLDRLAREAEGFRNQADQLRQTLFGTGEQMLDLRQTQVNLNQSIQRAVEVGGDAEATDLDRRAAMLQVASQMHDLIQDHVDLGASTEKVRQVTERQRAKFIETAIAAGIEEGAAEDLANELGLIPDDVATQVELIGDLEARARIAELRRQLALLDGSVATMTLQQKIERTEVIQTIGMQGVNFSQERQHGGPVFPGSLFLVGERGPELVRFRQMGQVIPANETRRIIRGDDGAMAPGMSGDTFHFHGVREDEIMARIERKRRIKAAQR